MAKGVSGYKLWCPKCDKGRSTTTVAYHVVAAGAPPLCRVCSTPVEYRDPVRSRPRHREPIDGQRVLDI